MRIGSDVDVERLWARRDPKRLYDAVMVGLKPHSLPLGTLHTSHPPPAEIGVSVLTGAIILGNGVAVADGAPMHTIDPMRVSVSAPNLHFLPCARTFTGVSTLGTTQSCGLRCASWQAKGLRSARSTQGL